MPPIPWDPYQSDFWYNEILPDIQARLNAGDRIGAEKLAREGRLTELADDIYNGSICHHPEGPAAIIFGRPAGAGAFRHDAVAWRAGRGAADRARPAA